MKQRSPPIWCFSDSVVDLVIGLGVPASKIVISLPATAQRFHLLNETLSTPGSPATEDHPKEIDQDELCRLLQKGRWTLERDQDLSAPYAFKDKTWISFEDSSSVDVKGKYARVRGLAGLALHKADKDVETPCGPTLKTSLAKVLNQQSRAPRAAVLRSLEHEILSAPGHARALDALQVSPYRITQIVDSDGVIHSIREDTRTEFSCSRQGYFVHPRSCARFYRCVKFDQLSPEYTVFEFDCPAGLAFDSRYEVCVWPGSLPDSQACPGSSEIAPVPQTRFVCPEHEGYYADPENCRWFFACLDHGKAPLTAYEFRCPFGLGFDAEKLKCDWPWLVPACGNIARYEAEAFGYGGAAFTGATGFQGQTADSINIAAHQSLISGASLDNHVGIQNGFLSHADALDSNFIASQELQGHGFQAGHGNALASGNAHIGLVQPTKYTSGSIILDDYRLPTKGEGHLGLQNAGLGLQNGGLVYQNGGQSYQSGGHSYQNEGHSYQNEGQSYQHSQQLLQNSQYNGYATASFGANGKTVQYQSSDYSDNSGAYVHDPTGDYAEPYRHVDSPVVPYVHTDSKTNDYNDYGRYSASHDYSGKYNHDNSGSYQENNGYAGSYNADYSGSYSNDNSGKYNAGVYRADGHIGEGQRSSSNIEIQHGNAYGTGNAGYLNQANAYTGGSHTLTAGAVNVGLVGKTTLVDASYNDQFNYNAGANSFGQKVVHQYNNGHVPVIQNSGVSINHIGTDQNNLDGYSFVTTPTSSGVPTTATPFAVTTAIPVTTFKTTYVPEAPKTDIKQIFTYSQPAVTYVQPTVTAVKQYVTPKVQVTDYNQGYNYQASNRKSESSGYVYSKPEIKFEEGVTYSTPAPVVVSTFKPQGFSHTQQTVHNLGSGFQYSTPVPVTEEPFKKVVAYTTGPELNYEQPTVSTYAPSSFSHETVHKVQTSNVYVPPSYQSVSYEQPQTVYEHTTAQPVVVAKYQPQGFSHQTLHKVDASQVNTYSGSGYNYQQNFDSGYKYDKPASGYEYSKPEVKFEEIPNIQYSTPAPVESTYKPSSFSHQTIHQTQQYIPVSSTPAPVQFTYQQPAVTYYQNPILKYVENVTPATYVQPTPQSYSHQTIHKVQSNQYVPSVQVDTGYKYEAPQTVVEHTTAQPVVTTTYQPQSYSHETVHKVEASKVNTYSNSESGYSYEQPAVRFEETPNVQYTTPAPVVSTYQPHSYHQETYHETKQYVPVSTQAPKVEVYQQPAITTYENPIIKFTQNVTPAPTYIPSVQQHEVNHVQQQKQYYDYSYSQPEIQRETYQISNAAKSYSDASLVSHQTYHQYNSKNQQESGKNIVFVSSTPSNLIYEDHYSEYEAPKFKAPEYVPPKTYSISSTAAPVVQQSSVYHQTQDQYDYKQGQYSQDTGSLQQVSFSTSHVEQPKTVESVHFSSVPEIQIEHREEYVPVKEDNFYLPPSTTARPIVTSTYKPRTYPTTEYLPPSTKAPEYLPPQPEYTVRDYLPPRVPTYQPPSTTARPSTKAPEYLPPSEGHVVNYNSFGFNNNEESYTYNINPYQEVTVSSTPQTNLLGFGTVGPDAGLVSTFTTGSVSSTYSPPVTSTYAPPASSTYLPPVTSTYLPPRTAKPRVRPTTKAPEYLPPVESTTFRAPEYLPPADENINFGSYGLKNAQIAVNPYQEQTVFSTSAPVTRKQNIVVQNAKSNLLGFGTIGNNAGLVTDTVSYSTSTPVTSTYAPVQQEVVQVTQAPARRTKPKVAVVTKINDFNPLLVRKLGAVCSCQSPIVVLKGRRPSVQVQQQDFDEYSDDTDYEDGRGDIRGNEWALKSARLQAVKTVTESTFNPIIVPDDSFYQDADEVTPKAYSKEYVSSTPAYSTTQRVVKIRPRVKAVTVAPTYKTVVLNQEVAPNVVVKETVSRGRDDLPDCQRAGLFRHPTKCNKFYACRWDCDKQKFTVHTFNCPVQLSFDPSIGACNWPSQGPSCQGDTLLTNSV
ncbi:chitin binding peritrophin-A domain-containing protein [Phthorimaea operculella]|nr:chitin binding peritrophin-A domain-containing protein [Phthorimaea operculella]